MDVKYADDIKEHDSHDSGHATESEDNEEALENVETSATEEPVKQEIVWKNIIKFVILHSLAFYSLTLLPSLCLNTWIWLLATYLISGD